MKKVKLSEIADVIAGQSPESIYYTADNNHIPFLQGNRTFGDIYPIIDTYTTKVTKIAPKGSVLMSVRAPVGDLNIATEDVCIGRGLVAINAKNKNNQALYYILKQNIPSIIKRGNGTTYESITMDILNNVDLIIPEDTSLCANVLSGIDDQIQRNNEMVQKLPSSENTRFCIFKKGGNLYVA